MCMVFHFNKLCAGTWEIWNLLLCICKGRTESDSASGGFRISHMGRGRGEVGHQKLGFWQNPFLVGYFAENARYWTERRLTSLAM